MFLLDSLLIGGIRWALDKAITAADAEMNDDSALREALLEAEMRREMGEISDEEFAATEADLLARIREIKQRRDGGAGPLAFGGGQPMETSPDSTFQIEADISGDFYGAPDTPKTDVITVTPTAVEEVVATPPPPVRQATPIPPVRVRRAAPAGKVPKAKSARLRRS